MKLEFVNRTREVLPRRKLERLVRKIIPLLSRHGLWHRPYRGLTVVFIPDGESKKLNTRFRKKPKPTTVLSFDYGEQGELLFAPGVIRNEAERSGQDFETALLRLIIHGMLHLGGLHHERSPKTAKTALQVEEILFSRVTRAEKYDASPSRFIRSSRLARLARQARRN